MPKTKCAYCRGYTFDDNRGHCVACGAPRDEVMEKPVLMPPWPALPYTGTIPQQPCYQPYVYIGDAPYSPSTTNCNFNYSDVLFQGRTAT